MPVLFPFLEFDPEETAISYAARLASLHIGSSVLPFLRDIEVKASDLLACKDQALERLASMAGVDVADLHRNSARSLGKRWFDLRGNVLSAEFFANPYTVFCPACLREDDAGGADPALARRGRLIWTLRPVRTCPVHGLALIRRKKVAWDDAFHQLALRVPERNDALDELVDGALQRSPSPLQEYVIARLDGAMGPTWLDSQTLEQAVRATEMLGVLLEFGPEAQPGQLSDNDWDAAGRAGYAATSKGEGGIRDAFQATQSRFLKQGIKPERGNVLGATYRWLASPKNSKDPGDIRRIMREHIFATIEVAAGTSILGERLPRRRLHSVESLASEAKLDPRTLRNVLAARGLVPIDGKVTGYHVFDADEGDRVAASIQRSTNVISLPKALNCTRPQAGQLVDEGMLDPIADGRKRVAGRTRKAIDNRDIERFLLALRASTRPTDKAVEGMVPISKAAEKARLSCMEIVHLVLGGFLQNVARIGEVEGYAAILVDPVEIRTQKALHLPGISASQAFARLKLPKSTGWELVHREENPRLEPIVIEGPNRQHRFFRFREDTVAAFASEYTTEIRVANANDVEKKDVVATLKKCGVRPVLGEAEIGLDLYCAAAIPTIEPA
ncbi:TniQ family protein [Poseidonocella sedimentorum]|uniref:TniQ protein n=1 Tax=Poseidonocella sedimentorum TaxID=871652 RepID=A0A1I6EMR0_9RHOB|nr:TniQ family protein [Poseidonocella sedimentorum]SFR18861.1 TniQ protein [Poseidonocella sedimentorum]